MKKRILFFLSITLCAPSMATVFMHDKLVNSKNGTYLKLKNFEQNSINTTYIPQQVITIHDEPKKLPLQEYIYARGIQYLKYISTENKTKDADKKMVELLIRKEPLGERMFKLLDNEHSLKPQTAVIRVYRKKTSAEKQWSWKPILTASEQIFKESIQPHIKVASDGEIHL